MLTVSATRAEAGTLEYPGSVAASQDAQLGFEVAGRIIEFPVAEGQFVNKGALLARLDDRDYQAQLARAKASRDLARADYERYKDLYANNSASLQELEVSRRNYEVAVADWETARKAVEDTELRALFGGRVAQKLVDDFANVQAKEPVVVLQDESDFEVVVAVPEADWSKAHPGLTLEERTQLAQPRVIITSLPDRSFPATLKEFATSADPVTRTYSVRFSFGSPSDVTVRSGMTAKLVIDLPETTGDTILVPSSAVAADANGDSYVWKVDLEAMTVSRGNVTVGELSGSSLAVLDGLSPGDVIATTGVHQLREGMQIRRLDG
jgi:RND family efflux transporter MFP subunit